MNLTLNTKVFSEFIIFFEDEAITQIDRTVQVKIQKNFPNQHWKIYPQKEKLAQQLAEVFNLLPMVCQLLINRGIETQEQATSFLNPEFIILPLPLNEFPDLATSLDILQEAITFQYKIAICGDYDADGMTSTALLLRSLRWLGAEVDYAIPSRMHEGYGINNRIVEEFSQEGVKLIITVDNGISAFASVARAKELGIKVIITDHHDLPQELPPADAILNPKLISKSSPYYGIAGVGVAYILAVSLTQKMGDDYKSLLEPMLELFTLGTIADLAPLTGVNRRWVKRGLQQLPKSKLPGIQALIQLAGVNNQVKKKTGEQGRIKAGNNYLSLKPDDIGFRLGPRINAIGRISDPQIVIDLLTTDDTSIALEKAIQCENINRQRQEMCGEIEREAIAIIETEYLQSLQEDRVIFVTSQNWHHGVIGIVASRLVERYGIPVFIGTYEDQYHIRGSARGITKFNVFDGLEYCKDLLVKYGGHKAAGGFSLSVENLTKFRLRLSRFANQCLNTQDLKPLLKIDTHIHLHQITRGFYEQLYSLEPCGIGNPNPIFWTSNVKVVEQQTVGKEHVRLTVVETIGEQQCKLKAIAWRWRNYFPLASSLDIAYKLRENTFNRDYSIELELLGIKTPEIPATPGDTNGKNTIYFNYQKRSYTCGMYKHGAISELRIRSPEGKILAVQLGSLLLIHSQIIHSQNSIGLLGINRQEAQEVNISQPPYKGIVRAALIALSGFHPND